MWHNLSELTSNQQSCVTNAQLSHELPCSVEAGTDTDNQPPDDQSSGGSTVKVCASSRAAKSVLPTQESRVHNLPKKNNDESLLEDDSETHIFVDGVCCPHGPKLSGPSEGLPRWVWTAATKLVGISLSPNEKPWLATAFHVLTFGSALTFIISRSWFIVYDITSTRTKRDALNGSVSIVIGMMWGMLAVYANKLVYRMFKHKVFAANIRFHSKTILKCNAACLLVTSGAIFMILSNYRAADEFDDRTCGVVELDIIVCKLMFVSRIIFSVFAYLWNTLVALVLMAVCRTHTFGIRLFIKDLEKDAILYDQHHAKQFSSKFSQVPDLYEEFISVDDDDIESHVSFTEEDKEDVKQQIVSSNASQREMQLVHQGPRLQFFGNLSESEQEEALYAEPSEIHTLDPPVTQRPSCTFSHTLSKAEILHRYWKLQCRIRMSSIALQRWMVCFVCLCLTWTGVTLIHWLSQSPNSVDVALFIIPLIMLPILSSAYAEVNNEGQRMLRCLCPSEDRLWLLYYLNQAPLQMVIYGFSIKYSTVVTTVFGLVAALTSGIILQEIKSL